MGGTQRPGLDTGPVSVYGTGRLLPIGAMEPVGVGMHVWGYGRVCWPLPMRYSKLPPSGRVTAERALTPEYLPVVDCKNKTSRGMRVW